jgi:hypothetical protein
MCSVIVYFLHCIFVCDCDSRHESLIMLSHSLMVRRSHLLARCYLGMMCMCTTAVRCSAIEGILHWYHNCGPMLILEEVAHDWLLRYLGAIGLLSLHVDVWRLIFLKLSLPRYGVGRCSAPGYSLHMRIHS